MKIVKTETLASFQGRKKVKYILLDNGTETYLTQERSFNDEIETVGGCKLNTVETDTKHVLFLFDNNDNEVGRYYLGKKLQGLSLDQIIEKKDNLMFFESWNKESSKWVPCVGIQTSKFAQPHAVIEKEQRPLHASSIEASESSINNNKNATNKVMTESEVRKYMMDSVIKPSPLKKQVESPSVIHNLSNEQLEYVLSSSYKCPICGEKHDIKDCVIVKQDTEWKFLNRTRNRELSTYRLRVYDEHYQVKYYNVRVCKKCVSRRKRHYIYAAIVVIIGLISLIIRNLVQFPNENFGDIVNHFLLALIPGGILGAVIYCGLCVIIAKSHQIDVEKAKQNNAIAPA